MLRADRSQRPAEADSSEVSTGSHLRDTADFEALIADLSSRFVNLARERARPRIEGPGRVSKSGVDPGSMSHTERSQRPAEADGPAVSTSSDSPDAADFETLIADLSSRFVNLAPDELDHEIEDALRRVCEPLGIDLALLWQWSDAPGFLCPPTAARHRRPAAFRAHAAGSVSLPMSQLLAGVPVIVRSPADLPAEAAVDRETFVQFGIKSGVGLPLAVGKEPPMGALGLNALREGRDWPDWLVTRLQLIGAGLLQRARPPAPRPEPAGERGAPDPGGGRRRGGALDPRHRHRPHLGDGPGAGALRVLAG